MGNVLKETETHKLVYYSDKALQDKAFLDYLWEGGAVKCCGHL